MTTARAGNPVRALMICDMVTASTAEWLRLRRVALPAALGHAAAAYGPGTRSLGSGPIR